MGVDHDERAADAFRRNVGPAVSANIEQLLKRDARQSTELERLVGGRASRLDILAGGPPCQGHSNLNNHTRRSDPRNALYLAMVRAAEILEPRVVLVENVPPVLWDHGGVVSETERRLRKIGYSTASAVLNSYSLGVPQRRRRFFLLGVRDIGDEAGELMDQVATLTGQQSRTVRWAIGDIERAVHDRWLDAPSRQSAANRERAAFLIRNGLYDLPNTLRPPCHRDNPTHSYKSMYGRLQWDEPAQTITSGFGSMGQGRYVHPSQPRTLTPHEAARLQTIPDWFDWGHIPRGQAATMIGNAVPPLMAAGIGRVVIGSAVKGDGGH